MIVPLTLLKKGSVARIEEFAKSKTPNNTLLKLNSVGFIRGRDIQVLNKNSNLYVVRIENENPFCILNDVADTIIINADAKDVVNKQKKTSENFLKKIKNFLKELIK